jgi:hypothetical protein
LTSFLSARRVVVLDIVVAVWIVFWIVVAVGAASRIDSLKSLADPVVHTADGLQQTVKSLEGLSNIPFVGGSIGGVVKQVEATAASAANEAAKAKATIRRTALLVGIALGVGPAALALLLYLPFRLPWRRKVADIRRALAADPNDSELARYLARQALGGMSYAEVRAWGRDPWREAESGDAWPLAALELRRLGLRRPPLAAAAS